MSVTLENIEKIIDRTKVSYKEAKETLEACGGDVVEAIIQIEQSKAKSEFDDSKAKKDAFEEKKNSLLLQAKFWGKQLMKALKKAMLIKVLWKKDDKVHLELPFLLVLIFAIWAMPVSIIALALPFFFGIKMQIKRTNGNVTDLGDWVKDHTPKSDGQN
ncbi:hypothetical protein [Fusibacter bizertensis]